MIAYFFMKCREFGYVCIISIELNNTLYNNIDNEAQSSCKWNEKKNTVMITSGIFQYRGNRRQCANNSLPILSRSDFGVISLI